MPFVDGLVGELLVLLVLGLLLFFLRFSLLLISSGSMAIIRAAALAGTAAAARRGRELGVGFDDGGVSSRQEVCTCFAVASFF